MGAIPMMNGGQLLVNSLIGLGAKYSFGVPGESYLAVLDALYDVPKQLNFTICRNEAGAAYMAEAYGKLTGEVGVCFVTRGPGATNASIGIHTARQNSTPMILFVGQVGTDQRGREAFQEIDYPAYFNAIAKWAVEIDDVARIPEILNRAWSTALSGRPGPVVVALPENMLTALTNAQPLSRAMAIAEPAPDARAMGDVVKILEQAQRPLLIVGGGGWTNQGRADIQSFAEANFIPSITAFRFHDLFDNTSPVFAGEAGVGMSPNVRKLITEADVVLGINIRFGEMTTDAWSTLDVPNATAKIIHSHVSAGELGKIYVADLAVNAGPNTMAAALADVHLASDTGGWCNEANAAYKAGLSAPAQPSPVDMSNVMEQIQATLQNDAIITNGAGNFAIWPNKFFSFGPKHRLLAPQNGTMGYGVPAAIMAKHIHRDRQVICFAGDGDFQMNCQELGTALQLGVGPVILILNNGTYGTIRMHQERTYPERISGTDIVNPDFTELAKSYGFHAERVETTADFAEAFARALASPTGAVLDLNISIEALAPRQTLTEMREIGRAAG